MPHSFTHSSVFGLWVATPCADHIVVERGATPSHRRHIVLHEIGHIVFDHDGEAEGDALWADLTARMSAEIVVGARPRGSYDTAAEYEAELFASIVEAWIAKMDPDRRRGAEASALYAAFDDPWGWR